MLKELDDRDKQVANSQGFLEEWLKDSPPMVREHLDVIVSGVAHYREKFLDVQEDLEQLQENYNRLTSVSAGYLQLVQEQKEIIQSQEKEGKE